MSVNVELVPVTLTADPISLFEYKLKSLNTLAALLVSTASVPATTKATFAPLSFNSIIASPG